MPIDQDNAQSLCSPTEWKTVSNTFPPRLDALYPPVAKKHANRIKRFLERAEGERAAVFEEALERLQSKLPESAGGDRAQGRREKEQASRLKAREARRRRTEVRTKLQEKAAEEKAAGEGRAESEIGGEGATKPGRGSTINKARTGRRKV